MAPMSSLLVLFRQDALCACAELVLETVQSLFNMASKEVLGLVQSHCLIWNQCFVFPHPKNLLENRIT